MCTAVCQDKLLVTDSTKAATQDLTAVDCFSGATYDTNGVLTGCTAGQYFNSDGATPTTTWNPIATVNSYGAWTNSPANGSAYGCLTCHHNTGLNIPGLGGAYLIGGHKNILRKIVPNQPLLNSEGLVVTKVVDHNGVEYTMNWATAAIGSETGFYLAGWIPEPDVFGSGSALAYGSCGRCHTTGYRFDDTGPEPTKVVLGTPNTYTKLTSTELSRTPAGSASTVSGSWFLTGIQCERCHKADVQLDQSSVNVAYNTGTTDAPIWTGTQGRVNHFTKLQIDVSNVNLSTCAASSHGTNCDLIAPMTFGDLQITSARQRTGTAGTYYEARPVPKAPYALLCVECHQAYSTWTSATGVGQTHMTPLPGFESLAPKASDTATFTSTKEATGQFTSTLPKIDPNNTATNAPRFATYDACVAAVPARTDCYTPGGMSHGAVTTILNSPHARVTGYVDVKNPATADSTLTIKGGTVNGVPVPGKINSTHFTSEMGVAGSCMGCHNIHGYLEGYVETNAVNVEETLKKCTDCHTGSHAVVVNHPSGFGTPFPNGYTGTESEGCVTCHMTKAMGAAYHFLRINPDAGYSTFPDAQTYYTTYGSGKFGKLNTYDSGETYTDGNGNTQVYPAVGLDVDIACGQCHVGGNGVKKAYDNLTVTPNGAKPLTKVQLATYAAAMHGASNPTPTVATPQLSLAPGTYPASSLPLGVSLYDATIGAAITYGTAVPPAACVPTANAYSPGYLIPINQSTTVCAQATLAGFANSAVASATYTIQLGQAAAPIFSIPGGTYNTKQNVQLLLPPNIIGPTIQYCIGAVCDPKANGTPYTTAIPVVVPTVIRAIATGGAYGDSSVVQASYNIVAAPPTFDTTGYAVSGINVSAVNSATVNIVPPDTGMAVFFLQSLNGAAPTLVPGNECVLVNNKCPVTVTTSSYLRAIVAYRQGTGPYVYGTPSPAATLTFVIKQRVGRQTAAPRAVQLPAPTSATTSSSAVAARSTASSTQTVSAPQTSTATSPVGVYVSIPLMDDDAVAPAKEAKPAVKVQKSAVAISTMVDDPAAATTGTTDADKAETNVKEGEADATR